MNKLDTLQRFMFEHANIRGEIAHLNDTYRTIMHQHAYPSVVKKLLGEALISCLLLSGSIKFEGEISLQFHGNNHLPLLIVQCDHELQIRAYAKYQEGSSDLDYTNAFLDGKMSMIINQYNKTEAYQSIVPIRSISMSDNLTHYFAQSEQVATQIWLAVNDDCAAGMLLQLMPGQDTIQREQFWEYAVVLGQTLSNDELLTLDNPTILHRLYHECELRLYSPRTVSFQCRCSSEKMKQAITVLGEEDINQLLQEKGNVEINCEFCNQNYIFDKIDIALIFRH